MSAADRHGQRLSMIDSSFLRLESADAHMHIGWSAVFAVAAGVKRPTVHALRRRATERLHWVPRCRQRLLTSPLGTVGEPRWVDHHGFDVAEHVTELTAPGEAVTMKRFAVLRDALLSTALRRDRPLWQIVVVSRLEDGSMGIVGRVHHAMADGTAAMQVAMLLADTDIGTDTDTDPGADADADADADAGAWWAARPAPGALRWAADPFLDGAQLTRRALRDTARAARHPRSSAGATLSITGQIGRALRDDILPRAPESSLNTVNGPRRTLIGYRTPLEELRDAKGHARGTINDIALAVVSGALRDLALQRGEPTLALKAMLPVSQRQGHQLGQLGNQIAPTMVWLPLHLDSPRARLAYVREQTERFKHARRPQGYHRLLSGLTHIHGPPRDVLLRAAASPRAYNLAVSNVRGPEAPFHILGARLQEMYPVVPIGHAHALAIGMFSNDAHLNFGLHADPDTLPHATQLPALFQAEIGALSRHHANTTKPRGASHTARHTPSALRATRA